MTFLVDVLDLKLKFLNIILFLLLELEFGN